MVIKYIYTKITGKSVEHPFFESVFGSPKIPFDYNHGAVCKTGIFIKIILKPAL